MFALPSIVALLAQFVPLITSSSMAATAVDAVVALAPVVVKTAPALISQVKDIIATLRGSAHVTPEKMADLDASEAIIDADYEASLRAARAEDAAAKD